MLEIRDGLDDLGFDSFVRVCGHSFEDGGGFLDVFVLETKEVDGGCLNS